MTYQPPRCLECKRYQKGPDRIGGQAKCTAYPKGVPRKIYFEGGDCRKFAPKGRKG